ncbi:glycoside hydrolase family 28 protein [Siphonobacter curvatus]|uniref:Exo-poly-alpha-D-galacturonosidase n=1 Tax=Siphonobacter curvatus TaxID=2094562 RepID=A0A2S7IR99_9BACT|nr:glycoside hydrolase family 28 protein [Siphonobacter curvatus]PQA60206.1 exo-poly-alpha-D-galacturonosidase [Siphonobacter curvatus]
MMKHLLLFFLLLSLQTKAQNLDWVTKTGARRFPDASQEFSVNAYGAKADGKTLATKAIQKAIDACAQKGGGVVTFKPGSYVTGALFVKSNVHLKISKDVLILGSEKLEDYPDIDTRVAGIEMKWPAALFNVMDAKNAAVTGEGVVNARGKFNWDLYWKTRKEYDTKGLRWIVDYDVKRVRTFLVQNSSDITLKGLTFKNAGFWTVQLLYSDHLTVDGVVIRNNEDGSGPSTDGVDVDSSTWVLVENCDIDCNDDNFCLKAGRDWDGLRVNKPTEYVVIRKCIARRGAGLVTLGSETSGGIRHVLATDLYAKHTDNGLRIKSATTRGGTIEDIYFQNTEMDSLNTAFQFNLNWYPAYSYSTLPAGYTYETIPAHWKSMLQKVTPVEKGIPYAKNIYVRNVKVTNAQTAFVATGLEQSLLKNFVFTESSIQAQELGVMEYTSDWYFDQLKLFIGKKQPKKKTGGVEDEERLK